MSAVFTGRWGGGMNVQWQGHAEIVPMPQADVIMDRVIKKMVSVPDFWPPIFKFREHDYVVIKITPTYMTMMEIKAQTISSPLPGYEVVLDT